MTGEERSFEQLVTELEEIVRSLEIDELTLDEALALFERGVSILRDTGRLLDAARGRLEELFENASGELSTLGLELDRRSDLEGD